MAEGGNSGLHGTLKNVCIFICFLVAVLFWYYEGKPHLGDILPSFHNKTMTIWIWATAVVAVFHLLYHYMSKCNARAVYIITAVVTLISMIFFDQIDIF